MIPGQRRKHSDGRVIVHNNNGIRVMLHRDCITINAMDREGMGTLNLLGSIEKALIDKDNVVITRDGMGDIHLIEIYYMDVKEEFNG